MNAVEDAVAWRFACRGRAEHGEALDLKTNLKPTTRTRTKAGRTLNASGKQAWLTQAEASGVTEARCCLRSNPSPAQHGPCVLALKCDGEGLEEPPLKGSIVSTFCPESFSSTWCFCWVNVLILRTCLCFLAAGASARMGAQRGGGCATATRSPLGYSCSPPLATDFATLLANVRSGRANIDATSSAPVRRCRLPETFRRLKRAWPDVQETTPQPAMSTWNYFDLPTQSSRHQTYV